ncbi:calcium-binding protein [Acinetobacter sp. WZC-1]|uniref:calcium-binding protein n=1 Tax=Acinetobacter sp. WZC-1 TaxID=3459034 RepID=UPI00403E293D
MAIHTFEGNNSSETIIGVLNDRTNIINAHGGDDIVYGNEVAQNFIDGGDGDDQLRGGNAIDYIQGGLGDDFIFGLAGNDEIQGGNGDDTLFGGLGDDLIIGGDGRDWLQGDEGADTLIGGLGDDSYDVDEFDTIIENLDEGYDAIFIADNFDLEGTNLEEIRLKGTGNFSAIGDANNNGLYGNDGNNYLDGKGGADIMSGGAGDDYYVVDQYDRLITNPDESTTLIRGDQIVEGLLNPVGYVFGDSGGIDTVEQWDDHRFYSQDSSGNWYDTGNYSHMQIKSYISLNPISRASQMEIFC